MNILIIGKFSEDQFGYHISETLKEMGNTTINYDPSLEYKYSKTRFGRRVHQLHHILYSNLTNTQYFQNQRKKRLIRLIENTKIDLTITTHDFLFPEEVEFIKAKSKAPVVMWFPDSISGFQKGLFFISEYDALFFKDPYIVEILKTNYNKNNIYYLPECCNSHIHKSIKLTSFDLDYYGSDISTYGNPHNIRTSLFSQLTKYNYDIKIWGHQPSIWLKDKKLRELYTGVYVFNESKARSVLAAKINLNTLHPTEIQGLNVRAFEIAGIGGFQLIHWRAGLKDLFEDGKEIVSFNNFDDLIDKIKYYLDAPEKRINIAKSGQYRAHRDHTYEARLNLLINTVFNNKKEFSIPFISK